MIVQEGFKIRTLCQGIKCESENRVQFFNGHQPKAKDLRNLVCSILLYVIAFVTGNQILGSRANGNEVISG